MKNLKLKVVYIALVILLIIQAWYVSYYIDFFAWSISGAGLALMVIPFFFTPLFLLLGVILIFIERKNTPKVKFLRIFLFIFLPILYSLFLTVNSKFLILIIFVLTIFTIIYTLISVLRLYSHPFIK